MIHELKIYHRYFDDVVSGEKPFEVRRGDRDYKAGDYLALNEYNDEIAAYTGRSCLMLVTYILDDEEYCKSGFVIMGIKPCEVYTQKTDGKE